MSFSRRQCRSRVRPRLEQLERRDVPAVLTPTTFANAGTFFNDATRRLEGGLWQIAVQESNQPTGFVARYVTDLTNVRDTIIAERGILPTGVPGDLHNVSATTNTHLDTILADLTNAIEDAPESVTLFAGAAAVDAAAAQTRIRSEHLQILNIVHNDDTLADLATAGGAVGFKQVPHKLGVALQDAPHETFNQIGNIFNDAANRIIGGLGSEDNTEAIKADISVMITSLTDLAKDFVGHPGVDQQLARIHILVIRDQLPLWVKFIDNVNTNPVAPKGSNDITLDLIDIARGDPVLAAPLTTGWGVYPDFTTPPTPYRDDAATKAFFATMDSAANNLGNEGVNDIVTGASAAARADLITRLQNFGTFVGAFDAAKGGLFEARFDNELVAINSTTGAAIVAMIEALNTNNLDLAKAAALQMHANVADVSGNNRWVSFDVNGVLLWHKYNADGTTAADNPLTGVLNQPGTVLLII
jgi:hypothetical protein